MTNEIDAALKWGYDRTLQTLIFNNTASTNYVVCPYCGWRNTKKRLFNRTVDCYRCGMWILVER